MSQQAVLQILYELGGSATSSEIIKFAREKYPDLSLWQYIGDRLRKLKRWGLVDYDTNINKYFIIVGGGEEKHEAFGQLSS
ncbi:MAG: hypothetical protein ACJ71P_11860 [Nitrososphaeraceae archaeon]|jgi:hypothetical protein